jgi:hypothetical protein
VKQMNTSKNFTENNLEKICYYHIFTRKNPLIDGVGNCEICRPDKTNKICRDYFGITPMYYEVKKYEQ